MPMTRSRTNKSVEHDENGTNGAEPDGEAEGAGVAEAEPQDTVTAIEVCTAFACLVKLS